MNYYVYYKVDTARLAELRAAVDQLFAAVERDCGVRGRLMRRRDDPTTYMEVYEDVADETAFEGINSLEEKQFPYPRRVERFQCV